MFRSRKLALAYLFMGLLPVLAQVAGSLTGRVVDSSGAAVPNATVAVYMPGGKSPLLSGKTDQAGIFSFIAVQPERYEVVVNAPGFSQKRIEEVKVNPVQETSLGSVTMEVQASSQVVEVTENVNTVQLANSEISSTITNTQVQNLPVSGRQVSALYSTQLGVNATNDVTAINGLSSSFSSLTIDGVNVQDNFIRTNALDYPPMRTTIDQIAEIQINTTNAGATIGGAASEVVLVTKSGSNDYHGAVYWYNRNSALGANNWFNNQAGVKRPQLDLNQAGAALGGRIIRDKLFFYGNYEGFRNKQQSSYTDITLTDSAKQGIFSYKDASGALQQVNLLNLRSFTIDPTIKSMLASLPEPNLFTRGDGLNTAGYLFNAAANENRDQVVYRMDYYLSQKHSFSGTFNYINDPTLRPDVSTNFTVTPPVSNVIKNYMMSLAYRWTISPTLTNELRGGFTLSNSAFLDSNKYPSFQLSGLLFTDPVNTFMNQGRQTNYYTIQDNANWVHGKHSVQFGYQSSYIRTAPYNDAGILPTYTLGLGARTNNLTSADLPGASTAYLSTANSLWANLAGYVSGETQTFNATSPSSGYVSGATQLRHLAYDTFAGYVQDNWKFSPTVTVSVGLRYEVWTPVTERDSLYLTPGLENGNIIKTLLDPSAVLGFSGGPSQPLYKTDWNNFAPNVGLAWDPFGSGKTAIRMGYMIAYSNDNTITTINNNGNTASGASAASTPALGNTLASLGSPFPIPVPAFSSTRTELQNYALNTQAAVGRPDPNLVTPYVQQWTIGIQHEFKGTVFEARYVGNHGTKLIRAFDYNQILYNANGFLADFKRAQGNLALSGNKSAAYNSAIPGSQPLTVLNNLPAALTNATVISYLQQGQVGELANFEQYNYAMGANGPMSFYTNPYVLGANTVANGGSSSYNGLQLEIRKRTRSGLQFQFSYDFSKTLANVTNDYQLGLEPLLDNNNPSLEKARSPYDVTHVFKANYYYELPYGVGKRWHGNRLMNAVAGGWGLSGIWTYSSGEPYSIISGLGTLNRSARSSTTNTAELVQNVNLSTLNGLTNGVFMTGNGPYFISPTLINPVDGRGAEYTSSFSGEMFANPGPGTVGDLQRRMFTGPWQFAWNASLIKGVKIYERSALDLHFDFFNVFNHPTFYIPPSTGGDYGSVTSVNINNTTFGRLTSMNYGARVIQIGAYFRF